MKKLKIYMTLLGALCILSSACSKKNSDTVTPVVPLVVPPTTTAKLTISQSLEQASPSNDLDPTIIYSSAIQNAGSYKPLPDTYNDNIKSFTLPKGYLAVFAENQNGTGESICYVAAVSDIKANLPARLVGKVSYVRFIPIKYVDKKGVCQYYYQDVNSLKAGWYYNWRLDGTSSTSTIFVPMTWEGNDVTSSNLSTLIDRNDIDHLLSFNEPDNINQSNMTVCNAINGYKVMLQAGLRMVSPAVTQDNSTLATDWLPLFVTAANADKARIDVIALHWYDYGNQTNNRSTDQLTADAILNRFKAYIAKVHAAYPNQALWFTEYNCNIIRPEGVQKIFMKASATYLNSLPYVERYAYFFERNFPPTTGSPNYTLTAIGQTWVDIASPSAYTSNIIPN
jgi:hypothetical protein